MPAGKDIIRQGETGDSLFLIARGVARISIAISGVERDVATMFAGDYFGEIALIEHCTRTATCRAVTPCALYELTRKDFEIVASTYPNIYDVLHKKGIERATELKNINESSSRKELDA